LKLAQLPSGQPVEEQKIIRKGVNKKKILLTKADNTS